MRSYHLSHALVIAGLLPLACAAGAPTTNTPPQGPAPEATEGSAAPPAPRTGGSPTMPSPHYRSWNIWNDMVEMQARMDRVLAHAFARFQPESQAAGGVQVNEASGARISLEEQPDAYLVTAEIPGVRPNDIHIALDGQLLTISAETQRQDETVGANGQVVRKAHASSRFEQAFTLPGPVSASGLHTQYHQGVLTVSVPKAHS